MIFQQEGSKRQLNFCCTQNDEFYHIHTEKYSPKSYVVNFHTQMNSSQSEERTMVFTREKNDTSEATEVCEFRAKTPAFYRHLQLAAPLRRHSRRQVFLEEFFS